MNSINNNMNRNTVRHTRQIRRPLQKYIPAKHTHVTNISISAIVTRLRQKLDNRYAKFYLFDDSHGNFNDFDDYKYINIYYPDLD